MDMILSDEQMAAVTAGSEPRASWIPALLPEGRQKLPAWLKGLHIDWMMEYGNPPSVKLKVDGDVYTWPEQRWAHEGRQGLHIARHADGRARAHYHRGRITKQAIWRVCTGGKFLTQSWKPEATVEAARRAADKHIENIRFTCGAFNFPEHKPASNDTLTAWIKGPVDVTEESGGYGGSKFLLPMIDGSERLLWGPWHGPAPDGYVEVSTCDPHGRYERMRPDSPWHQRGGHAGLLITEDLFLRAVATYAPHVRCAFVRNSYGGTRLEPYQAEWMVPKRIWQSRQP